MNYLAVDVGGTDIKYALMNEQADILEKAVIQTPRQSFEAFKDAINGIYRQYADTAAGLAMSMPGIIDSSSGYCHTGGALLYNFERPLVRDLQDDIPVPVVIENDGKCAALAEVWKGNLTDVDDGIVVLLGTGVGGGIIKNKQLHTGKHFSAGEFSYSLIIGDDYQERNFAGSRCSVRYLVSEVSKAAGIDKKDLNGRIIFEMARQGNEVVCRCIRDYTKAVAALIYNLQCIYDPEKIALGGGISAQPYLIECITENFEAIYKAMPIPAPKVNLTSCAFFNDSNLIGALYNLLTRLSIL